MSKATPAIEGLRAAANSIDGRALDYTNDVTEKQRVRLRAQANALRSEAIDLAKAQLNNVSAEQQVLLDGVEKASKQLQTKIAKVEKAVEITENIGRIVGAVDDVLELALGAIT